MKSIVTRDFMECFACLPEAIRNQARRSYRLWKRNSKHPSLHFKSISGHEGLFSVRVGRDWRALGRIKDNSLIWFWIGSHAEYDRLVG